MKNWGTKDDDDPQCHYVVVVGDPSDYSKNRRLVLSMDKRFGESVQERALRIRRLGKTYARANESVLRVRRFTKNDA